jgi:predicted MPP superfamily phosphohydrolase
VLLSISLPALGDDFEFVVIGDTRPTFESESFRPFEGLISKINAVHPALVVNLGDLIYGYGPASKVKQWDKYEALIKALQVPYYQLPGNHDTHSREARRIYGRRFGKFYQSFDYLDCHFVLLDNTEEQRWGYLGSTELAWLREDLKSTRASSVFVFMHFPVWEPERITPAYYEFWAQTLHPLFKESRVRAVFGGHYHTYGPTREFDGIRYFITGGGGAELRPEYKKSGGEHHFMRIKVTGATINVSVVTEHGEMTDPEADVMGGLQFAARNVSRIGLKRDPKELRAGTAFSVTVNNPYSEAMNGEATWLVDTSAFSVEPQSVPVQILGGSQRQYNFTLKALQDVVNLQSLPRLEFNVVSGGVRRKFHRELRFLQVSKVGYQQPPPVLDGSFGEWTGVPPLTLGGNPTPAAELRACHDAQNLYLALSIPKFDVEEAKELGFSDELQLGIARPLSDTDFGRDFLRLGFSSDSSEARDRTPGRKLETSIPGVKSVCRTGDLRMTYEVAVPLRLLHTFRTGANTRLILDLSFPPSENGSDKGESLEPERNTFSYRIRYGSDSLVPVYFVELTLEPRR